jgi:hypothetical protein
MNAVPVSGVGLAVGGRLPALIRADGSPVWRPQYTRDSVLLAALHGEDCEPCARFRSELERAQPDFRAWDGRLVIAVAGEETGAPAEANRAVAETGERDPALQVAGRGGGTAPAPEKSHAAVARMPECVGVPPAIVVADRFGHIYHVAASGPTHSFPAPRELEEWLRFIGTQCPE